MIRYYWYITVKPQTQQQLYNGSLKGYIRRMISPPPDGLFYILEIIDGYKHTIKERDNLNPMFTTNDYGKPYDIKAIGERIMARLGDQWNRDNTIYREREDIKEKREFKKMAEESMINYPSSIYPTSASDYFSPSGTEMLMTMRKRKLKRKPVVARKRPCKCKVIKRRVSK
jgi:hypothetical protein